VIPRAYIIEWQHTAPWQADEQVEQDLIISRMIVDIFNDDFLRNKLLFRGGTALFKLFSDYPVRYSEDLDLVQIEAGSIKPIVQTIQRIIDPWLGKSSTQSRTNGFRIYYGFTPESDPDRTKRIKVEINTREHFLAFPAISQNYSVDSQWYKGAASVQTYELNELLGTKLRALYQRKKGRDLFDIAHFLSKPIVEPDKVIESFKKYLTHGGHSISKAQYLDNLEAKMMDKVFVRDIDSFIISDLDYNPEDAAEYVKQLINNL